MSAPTARRLTSSAATRADPDRHRRAGLRSTLMEQGTIEVDVDLHAFMADADEAQVDEELLVEEISIDGMCGVY